MLLKMTLNLCASAEMAYLPITIFSEFSCYHNIIEQFWLHCLEIWIHCCDFFQYLSYSSFVHLIVNYYLHLNNNMGNWNHETCNMKFHLFLALIRREIKDILSLSPSHGRRQQSTLWSEKKKNCLMSKNVWGWEFMHAFSLVVFMDNKWADINMLDINTVVLICINTVVLILLY